MATKKITEVDVVTSIGDNDFLYINQNNGIKQIKKLNIPKPKYSADEVGAVDKNSIATLTEMKSFLGL